MKNIYFIISLFLLVCSCKNKVDQINFQQVSIAFDTLKVEKLTSIHENSSQEGDIYFQNTNFFFVDKRFGYLYLYDKEGNYLKTLLGQGESPKELNTAYVDGYAMDRKGNHIFLGSSFDIHIHRPDLTREKTTILDWKGKKNVNEVRENALDNIDQFSLYTLDYLNLNLITDSKGNLFIPIYSENEKFNAFTGEKYYKEGKILAKYNFKSNKVEKLLGQRSDEYLKYNYIPHHAWFSYDLDSLDHFLINHEIDPKIYYYDNDFDLITTFGTPGKSMNLEYKEINQFDLKLFREYYTNDRPKRGYYHSLKCLNGLVFRSYTKNENSLTHGLQIYKDFVLIADVEVPKGLKVRGYIPPYYYGSVYDEESDKVEVYRFKL